MKKEDVLASLRFFLEPFMKEKGFVPKGRLEFLRKSEPHKREELLTLDSRPGRAPQQDTLFVSMTCGIYYKSVNAADAKIEKDFLNGYPIAGGSIGHFKAEGAGYLSIPISGPSQVTEAVEALREAVENGTFNLFSKYPGVASLIEGIEKKDPWLSDFHLRPAFREFIRQAAMRYVAFGKEPALAWFLEAAPEGDGKKSQALERMRREW